MYFSKETRYDEMKYNKCGKSGLNIPALSLGMWQNFGSSHNFDTMKQLCFTAFDNGITHFDVANMYGPERGAAEENLGRIIRDELSHYRNELLIATKAGNPMWPGPYGGQASRKHLINSIDESLKRTGLEYFDIFYQHQPDYETPLEEQMGALNSIVLSGKALYVGISNFDCNRTKEALAILRDLKCPCIVNQRNYSIFERSIEEEGLVAWCKENGVGIIAYSPLAQGVLTDKYLKGVPEDSRAASKTIKHLNSNDITPEKIKKVNALNEIAKSRGESLAQMALSWVLRDETVCSVLIGASRPAQIEENIKIINSPPYTKEVLSAIDEVCKNAG